MTLRLIRVACYVRVSHQEQKLHGISLDAQRDKLKEYAEAHGLKIVGWYEDEGISGRKLIKHRPALQRMLKDAQADKFDRILFIKLDRFFRSVAEYHECMKMIEPVVWTATEEKYDLATANGRAFVNMKLTIAELEADQTGERIDLVNEYKVKTGQALTGEQCQGYGYTVQKIDGTKKVVKNPETAPIVEDYIKHFLTHHNKKHAHVYVKNKYNVKVSYNSIGKVLTDTKTYGSYRGNDSYIAEPYVDKVTFDKIQEILQSKLKTPKTNRIYLFTGLIKCPVCNRRLNATCTVRQLIAGQKTYYKYRCNQKIINETCTYGKYISEEKVEQILLDNMEEFINCHIESVNVKDNREIDVHLDDKIKSIKSEMSKLMRMYRRGDVPEAEYDEDMDELKKQLQELESHLAPVEERDLTLYEELLKSDWRELYAALNRENKRAFWRKYIKEIKVNDKGTFESVIFF